MRCKPPARGEGDGRGSAEGLGLLHVVTRPLLSGEAARCCADAEDAEAAAAAAVAVEEAAGEGGAAAAGGGDLAAAAASAVQPLRVDLTAVAVTTATMVVGEAQCVARANPAHALPHKSTTHPPPPANYPHPRRGEASMQSF